MATKKNTQAVAVETVTEVVQAPAKKFSTNAELEARGFKTKSAKIRALHAEGMGTSAIAKQIGVIYQHARNVINQPLKKAGNITPIEDAQAVVEATLGAQDGDMRHAKMGAPEGGSDSDGEQGEGDESSED
jgi:hypothetical protein